jgi:hypothetical protein
MFEEMDDVFDVEHDLSDLENEAREEEGSIIVSARVLENLLEQIRLVQEELNDYHIRDAETEGWVSLPRNRYLRLLGLDLENRDLIRKNEELTEELEDWGQPDQFIEQPPSQEEIEFDGPLGTFDTTSVSSQMDPNKYRVYSPMGHVDASGLGMGVNTPPLLWKDTSMLGEKDIQIIVDEVMRKLGRRE